MKPERLEMVGFAPFRSRTVVDFSGLDLFALTGPTGAGKSSVIDAVTFALYGVVPRYDNKTAVEPVISLGAAEARVRFDFSLDDRVFSAVRVVRRKPRGGATVAEARLECEGEVLASGGPSVTKAVEALLGLNIAHFTRSVVLPQGDFADFLHDTPAGQQELIKALLDLAVLDTVRIRANERARTATAMAETARQQIDQLADATDEAVAAASTRLASLEELVQPVAAMEASIVEASEHARQQIAATETLAAHRRLLAAVRVPDGVGALSRRLATEREGVDRAEVDVADATQALDKATAEAEAIPSSDRLRQAVDHWGRLAAAREKLTEIDLDALAKAAEAAEAQEAEATSAWEAAVAVFEGERVRHAAHDLASGLGPGDPCPVCHRPLAEAPPDEHTDLEAARRTVTEARAALERVASDHKKAARRLIDGQATRTAGEAALADLEAHGEGLPGDEELERLLPARQAADVGLGLCRAKVKAAQTALTGARRRLKDLEEAERDAWRQFNAARDSVAILSAPPVEQIDLGEAWAELAGWAETESKVLADALAEAEAAAEASREELDRAKQTLEAALSGADVGGTEAPSVRLAAAAATARAEVERIGERLRRRAGFQADLARFEETAQVASALWKHLRANNFEGWLLAEALATLIEGANGLLAELSDQAYSLGLEGGTILVVDHRNADERRSVRSLSGGETFLVSLALALSLGEQLVNLSDRGGARLQAVFLDEGFGSLDPETLDTVSAVVTDLAAQGRVVGLVTHVKELAEQVPVRFEVRPGPGGATIERIGS